MRRIVLGVATTAVLVFGAALVASPAAATTTARDDNPTVCAATGKIVTDGASLVVADLNQAVSQAGSGNLGAAGNAVSAAGQKLAAAGNQVTAEAAKADDSNLKTAVSQLGTEMVAVGTSLTSFESLQNLNSSKVDQAAANVNAVCGSNPIPGVTGTAGPTASPTN